ncbi:cell division protein ZipA C-terminal FtsZ-binding domain-containing protein [Methylomonas paludis]|uniref:Cell division protein ZipA n=1 Tax=Methylomonas paludis TaxID=1173101 RepID=A0A975R8X9_9GAMM|nr:cell division protein ZipA C-terminal FtsZ-binding domain-containing protein [Methylomonas paludis]QWF69591.1 cell division protein ZipA C-terminal FtsZ-binding domain-containing protein [Methylomonas paludis]
MDKELLRVVIILIGVLVILGILILHFFKTLRDRGEVDDYDEADLDNPDDDSGYDEPAESVSVDHLIDGDALLDDNAIRPPSLKQRSELPKLLKFSIIARADEGFNGETLFAAFERAGLQYGSVQVFERLDKNRVVHFTVASLSQPGTFPDKHLDEFYCPGIAFYMEPRELENPVAVFDDLIETIDILAEELDGEVWDNLRQALTAETIAELRQLLH